MSQIKPGTRVVRGPDWNSKKQDNGEGFLGTVIFVPKSGSDDKKVTVIWDSGRELRYRAGDGGKYDLRVFDNAPSGVHHPTINCDSCGEEGIHGIRWKCCDCNDYDLCHMCYMNDKHDINHNFVRVDTPDSTAYNVSTRASSKKSKRQAKGIFPNAEVMRGPHWKWKNDDGGEGGVGIVKKLDTWGKDSYHGAVKIAWKADNLMKNYRVGGEGCVDVIYTRMTETASGGNYYADHLPLVDVVNPGQVFLKIGDKVVINLPLKGFRQLQDNQVYGGWDDDMKQCLDELGTIVGFLYNGLSVKLQYEDSKMWIVNKVALTRKHTFNQGDAVTVLNDYNAVKELQKGHGGWNDEMRSALGKNGRIVRLDTDGDMRVKVEDKTWIFNPTCITAVDDDTTAKNVPQLTKQETRDITDDEDSSSSDESGGQAVAESIAQLFVAMLREQPDTEEDNTSIVEAAAKGEMKDVQRILKRHPDRVDQKVEGKTALQLACYEGHYEIAELLLRNKADANIKDSEGDAPLHYAAYGKESKIVKLLLDNKANVNAINAKKQSALHISVNKGQPKCCKVLIDKGCDPNLKDDDNDTAMHDAISQKDIPDDIRVTVLGSKKAKFTTENTRGFNVLHWAVLKDSKQCVETILENDRSCVDSKMKDGSTAMHIAAANDRVEIASLLHSKGKADVNIRDNIKRTPLILAVSLGKRKTMELLITLSCDVNAQDNSGNTALHVAQVKKHLGPVNVIPGAKANDESQDTQIICYLIECGADIDIKNSDGKTPLDFANDDMVRHFMRTLAKRAKSKTLAMTQKGIPSPSNWEDMHGESVVKILLNPSAGLGKLEYESIQRQFEKTLPQAQIISIMRNQNMFMWEMYYLKKRNMERSYGGGCANELSLFHGTTPDKKDVIAEQNLDPRLAGGRVGALFGKGTYFATDAKYSDLYSQADQNGHKFMFLVKVLAGKTCIGKPEYARPPPQDPRNPKSPLFDSCVDNDKTPRIYCVFHDTQYYPEHLIEYT